MRRTRTEARRLFPGVMLGAGALLAGCMATSNGGPDPSAPVETAPHVVALSTYEASLGSLVEAYGAHFEAPPQGADYTIDHFLIFDGTYETDGGSTETVHEEVPVRRDDGGTLVWDDFGPFSVPFGGRDEPGTFRGTVAARAHVSRHGEEPLVLDDPEPLEITFRVRPSLIVREFQPTTATCAGPVKRALGGVPYRIRVEAMGFEPETFTYSLSSPGAELFEPIRIRHRATGRFDTVGERRDFRFPLVPDGIKMYGAVLSIDAVDREGRTHRSQFGIGVHRPIELFYNGNVQVAELEAPEPVSGCTPGGDNGRHATYMESTAETRRRNVQVNWNESWLEQHRVAEGSQHTIGRDETNGIGFATTDEQLFRWEYGGEAGGEFSMGDVVKVGLKGHLDRATQQREAVEASRDRDVGLHQSETTTHVDEVTEANERQQGGAVDLEVSTTELISRDFGGEVIAGTYGVFYRQTMRLLRRAALVTYNQCGIAENVADVDLTDWRWSADLALGETCPPLPASNLPPAQCNISPCSPVD